MQYKNRKEVPEDFKWDLSDYFKDINEYDKCYKKTKLLIPKLSEYKGFIHDVKKLKEFLKMYFDVLVDVMDLYIYAIVINDQELGVSESIDRLQKIENLFNEFNNATSYFEPELLEIDGDKYNSLINDSSLDEYRFYLDKIYRRKEHILSEDKENIVNTLVSTMNTYENIYSNLLNNEIEYGSINVDGEDIVISTTNYRKLMTNKDVNIRKRVYESFNSNLSKYKKTFAMLLNSYVSMNERVSNIYGFTNSWESKLFSWNLDDSVFKTLVDSLDDNIKGINRYYELRSHIMDKKKLDMYDLQLELNHNDKVYTIDEAQDIILKALKPLGEEYLSKIKKIFDNRYIDYCQYKGKCAGGYSISGYRHPSRILLSFNDDFESISTIIHECGHNVNHQYMIENNGVPYRRNTTIVGEVTSLVNECLLSNYFMNNGTTKEEKLRGVENILDVMLSNYYGAVRDGKIEQDFYKLAENGDAISSEFIDEEFRTYLKKYYGDYVNIDDYVSNRWIMLSHYYNHYYLYSYSISICAAIYVSEKILDGDKDMLDKYFEFLKCGDDKWTYEAFEILGIALNDGTMYKNAGEYFNYLIDRYYEILKDGDK